MAEKDSSQSSSEGSPPTAFCANTTYLSSRAKELAPESCFSSNPFVIKTSSSNDSADEGSKPIIAPSTLKLNDPDSFVGQQPQPPPISKVVLRPSRLAVQTEKLEISTSSDKDSKKESEFSAEKHVTVKDNPFLEGTINVSAPQLFVSKGSTSTSNVFSVSKESDESPACKNEESNASFVFGQNLHERVLNYTSGSDPEATPAFTKAHDLSFENAAQKSEGNTETEVQKDEATAKSLSESAKEYELKQSKRKYDEISVITGEEGESNALQINCKLFEFNMTEKCWQERGKGILRLNDQMHEGVLGSRVVMRTQGNLRVVLNTKVWAGMTVQHPSERKVQLSAINSDGIRVYLVMARPKDADQLYSALEWRVSSLKSKSEASNGNKDENSVSFKSSAENHNLNGNAVKRPRTDPIESSDSIDKFDSGEGDISSDSTKENDSYTS